MKKKSGIFYLGLACALIAFVATGFFSIPGTGPGSLNGKLLHPHFGAVEFAEVFVLTFALCLILERTFYRLRPVTAAIGFAFGCAVFALALLVIEARIQSYGIIVEGVIKSRYGSQESIMLGAFGAGALGLLVSRLSIGMGKMRRSGRPVTPGARKRGCKVKRSPRGRGGKKGESK